MSVQTDKHSQVSAQQTRPTGTQQQAQSSWIPTMVRLDNRNDGLRQHNGVYGVDPSACGNLHPANSKSAPSTSMCR